MACFQRNGGTKVNMADSSDSVVANNTNNRKDLSGVQSSDNIEDNKIDKGMCFRSKIFNFLRIRLISIY